jgi:type II secretory pathway component GspD/PulD (secretin)
MLWICIASFTALLRGAATNSSAQEASESAPPPVEEATDEAIVLNFEGADIREVINSLATALGINYSIDPRVQGQVTIRTTGKLPVGIFFLSFMRFCGAMGLPQKATSIRSHQ